MKRGIGVLLMSVLMAVNPVWAAQWWQPSPVSVALTVGQWLMRDRVKVYYVQVRATGADQQQTRDQAFRLAVEQAVGTLLVSETQVRNNELLRNEIINYSSGYVHDFDIISNITVDRGVELVLDVWVKHSAIADRVLHVSRDAGRLESDRISQQIRSLQQQRDSADRLLGAVLADFPARAFDVRLEPSRVLVTSNRQTQLEIPVVVGWSSGYITSLAETVGVINQRPDCSSWFKTCNVTSTVSVAGTTAYFDDTGAYDMMHREMVLTQPQIAVEIQDHNGQIRFRGCYSAPEIDHANWSNWNFVDLGGYRVMINPQRSKRYSIVMPITSDLAQSMAKIQVSMVRKSGCAKSGMR